MIDERFNNEYSRIHLEGTVWEEKYVGIPLTMVVSWLIRWWSVGRSFIMLVTVQIWQMSLKYSPSSKCYQLSRRPMSDMFFFFGLIRIRDLKCAWKLTLFALNPWYLVGCQVAEPVEKTESKEEANGLTGFFRGLGVGVVSENVEVGKLECKSLYHIFSFKEE